MPDTRVQVGMKKGSRARHLMQAVNYLILGTRAFQFLEGSGVRMRDGDIARRVRPILVAAR